MTGLIDGTPTLPPRHSGPAHPKPTEDPKIGSRPSRKHLDLPYLQVVWRGSRPYAYYRRDGQRTAVTDSHGRTMPFSLPPSAQWMAAYRRIDATFAAPSGQGGMVEHTGSLGALVSAFLASPDWKVLSDGTKRDYRRHLDYLRGNFGSLPVAALPRTFVIGLRDHLADRPRTANYVIQVLRRLLQWGFDRGWCADNPARRPKQFSGGPGHRPWEEDEIECFRAGWGLERVQRVAFELMLNTGLRGGDVIALTRGRICDNRLTFIQAKTKGKLTLAVPPNVVEAATALPRPEGCEYLLVNTRGRPFQPGTFRHMMRAAYRATGLPEDCTNHGLRYTAATRLREVGCDWEEIASVTGHRTAEMTRRYSNQERRATFAMQRVSQAEAVR